MSATTYSAAASSLPPDADGKLCYEVPNLEPDTTYRVSVAAFAYGVSSGFSAAVDVTTLPTPTIDAPVFSQVPKSVQVEAGKDATFTAQAGVGDGGAISYAWQHKGVGQQEFTAVEPGEKYAIDTDAVTGVTTLTVKGVGAEQVGAFRCVATNSKDSQTVNAVGAAAYLSVIPVKATNAESWATSSTTGEVTWTAEGAVRRFQVRCECIANDGEPSQEPERVKIVTIADDETQGTCQFDGLTPNSIYSILIDPAPQVGFWGSGLQGGHLTTPPASALETATVTMTPDQTVVEPGTSVTFAVATNVDDDASEAKEYRWQRNTFGEGWYDVDGANAATLNVTAPEGGSVEGYRCVVTSTTTGQKVPDTKTVTSDAKLLATNVPVAQPVQLAAEPDITSVHLTWSSDDARPTTYQVEYAQGPTPGDDAWTTVENVGAGTSCDVEGLAPNTVYSWRVKALVRDGLLQSDWAQADTFITLEDPSALATVSVTPRFGATIAGSGKDVTYAATTNIDNALNGEVLSYQWQESEAGVEWNDVPGATGATLVAQASGNVRSCLYRCVVTASKGSETLKTVASDAAGFTATPQVPTALQAGSITAATADLSWTGSLDGAPLTYRVFWRASGAADWTSTPNLTEATCTLNSLMPATTYEWYVQVMNDGKPSVRSATSLFVTQSLSPVPELSLVVVSPLDQTPEASEQATFAAYTNVDDMLDAGATLTYKWEKRDLGSATWTELVGKATREITLDPNTVGYVRCTVTYTPPAGTLAPPFSNVPVTSKNEARVRVMPALPSNLKVTDNSLTKNSVDLEWTAATSATTYDVMYSVAGAGVWQSKTDLTEAKVALDNLAPNTIYEWYVRAVTAYGDGDPLSSGWVGGSLFTTASDEVKLSHVEVTPSAPSIMADTESTVTLTATPDVTDSDETLAYQWQQKIGSDWQDVTGAQDKTLEVSAKTLSAGAHTYRCQVTATRAGGATKTVESNESIVTATPAAPTGLSVSDIQLVDPHNPLGQVKATFNWEWDGISLPDDAAFEVSYRGLAGKGNFQKGWISEGLTIDNENRTCQAFQLVATDITYQWRVRVVQNGAVSPWSEASTFTTTIETPENLNLVEVTPSDSLVSNDASTEVTLTASTNVDKNANKGTLTYAWEWCELTTPNPRSNEYENAWKPINGATSKEITLSGDDRNRYVRCKVTQTIDGVAGSPVASNPACVRTEPLSPSNLRESIGTNEIKLAWDCADSRANSVKEKVIGFEVNYRKGGASEWVQAIPANATDIVFFPKSCTLKSTSLEPDATYEWRVRTVLNNDVAKSWVEGGPHTEWVDGSTFVAPRVDVTPARAAAVIGSGRTLTFTVSANDAATHGGSETYQWERKEGTSWVPVQDATSKTLCLYKTQRARR